MDTDLKNVRNEILDALRISLAEVTAESELNQTRRQDPNTTSRINWVLENGQKSLRDLTIFFSEEKVYSDLDMAKYIWISCIFKPGTSSM